MQALFGGWVLLAVASSIIGSALAERRDAASAGGLLGLCFGPFGLILIVLIDRRPRCPACREHLYRLAFLCPHCRTALIWQEGKDGQLRPQIHPDAPLARQLRGAGIPFEGARATKEFAAPAQKPAPPPIKPFGP